MALAIMCFDLALRLISILVLWRKCSRYPGRGRSGRCEEGKLSQAGNPSKR